LGEQQPENTAPWGLYFPGWSIAANPKDSSEIQYDTKDMVKY